MRSLFRLCPALVLGMLAVGPIALWAGPDALAPDPDACRAFAERLEKDDKAHEWTRLLTGGRKFLGDCGSLNDTVRAGGLVFVGTAQLHLGSFQEALNAAKACIALPTPTSLNIDCRLIEADALDGLGRIADERAVLTGILDTLPAGKKDSKIRKLVEAALANIDPDAGKPGHATKRRPLDHPEAKDLRIYGTGFWISRDGYIVTNRHVIASCGPIHTVDGQALTLVKADANRDLAILKSTQAQTHTALLRADGAKIGEPVVVYGFPLPGILASSGNLATGIVSAESGLRDSRRMFQISAPVQPGNSGGPVLDASGRVIGVVVMKLETVPTGGGNQDIVQNANFAVAESELLGFLKEAGVQPSLGTTAEKQEVQDIAAGAKTFVTQIVCIPND